MSVNKFFHRLFIPSENNNYQAKALHIDFLTFYLILAIFISLLSQAPFFNNILGFATDITVEKLYQLTNKERIKNGLKPLSYNEKLAKAALEKAQDMFKKNYWAHYAPDGATPWDFILSTGYRYEFAGENLAKNFIFSDGVVQAWMNSVTHKENILRPEYQEIGFAVVNGILQGEETTLVVQMFGKPLNTSSLNQEEKTVMTTKNFTLTPSPAFVAGALEKNISQVSSVNKKPIINLKVFSFNYSLLLFFFLLIVIISDFYFAYRLQIIRISSKHVFHFMFLASIILILIFATKGTIL